MLTFRDKQLELIFVAPLFGSRLHLGMRCRTRSDLARNAVRSQRFVSGEAGKNHWSLSLMPLLRVQAMFHHVSFLKLKLWNIRRGTKGTGPQLWKAEVSELLLNYGNLRCGPGSVYFKK